jgi:capsule polysaccharide export protein KpsE/RkpR
LNGGRPVIILKTKNLVKEHDQKVLISYSFSKKKMIVEPLMLIFTYFVLFVLYSLFARFNISSSVIVNVNNNNINTALATTAASNSSGNSNTQETKKID